MKLFLRYPLALVALALVALAAACILPQAVTEEKARITIVAIGEDAALSRTIAPDASSSAIAGIRLYGKRPAIDSGALGELLLEKMATGLPSSLALDIMVGAWELTLGCYDAMEECILSGGASASITADGSNQVTILLHPVGQGSGSLSLSASWTKVASSDGAYIAKALLSYAGPSTGGEASGPTELPIDRSGASEEKVQHEVEGLASGQYLLCLRFLDTAGKSLAIIRELAIVASGLESSASYNLDDGYLLAAQVAAPESLAASYAWPDVSLSWIDSSWNESGFTVLRRPAGGSAWIELASLLPNTNSFVDKDPPGSSSGGFDYRVEARNSFYASESAAASVLLPCHALTYSCYDIDNGNASGSLPPTCWYKEGDEVVVAANPGSLTWNDTLLELQYWTLDPGNTRVEFGSSLAMGQSDISLIAIADIKPVTVYFNLRGGEGETPAAQKIDRNGSQLVAEPATPTREGYDFLGWFSDLAGFPLPWEFSFMTYAQFDPMIESFWIYAGWAPKQYMVVVHPGGYPIYFRWGSNVGWQGYDFAIDADYDSYPFISYEAPNTADGRVFLGWYRDAALTQSGDPCAELVKGETHYYAKWSNLTSSVSFDFGGSPTIELSGQLSLLQGDLLGVSATAGFSSYAWYVDGVRQAGSSSAFSLDTAGLSVGPHGLSLVVKDALGVESSARCRFAVTK